MNRLKLVLRVGGVMAAALGILFLPIGYGVSPPAGGFARPAR
jgi:hypothetical protein